MGKKKFGVLAMLASGLAIMGCASISNLVDPIHAVNGNGEKVAAAWGPGGSLGERAVVEGETYSFTECPSVPAAPKEPRSPGPEPVPSEYSGHLDHWYYPAGGGAVHVVESWSSLEELESKLRKNSYDEESAHLMEMEAANRRKQVQEENKALAQYRSRVERYQEDLAVFKKENAEYQAKLPQYQAEVAAQIKTIQDTISPEAPGNWFGYVEGRYLLYKGKVQ